MEVIYQGRVATDGSTRITCTSTSLLINVMIINGLNLALFNLGLFLINQIFKYQVTK